MDFDTPLDLLVEGLSGVDTVGIKLLTRQPADKLVKRKIPVLLGWESAAASQAKPGNR